MNIALICGSPKKAESVSETLLHDLKPLVSIEGNTLIDITLNKPSVTKEDMELLQDCQAWVFAFPLYVDGIPSHLVHVLEELEQSRIGNKNMHVYGIVNAGFYEGRQCRNALSILQNWCSKAGLIWGMGIGFGGGGALNSMKTLPLGAGPKNTLGSAYQELTNAINAQTSAPNIYTSIGFPRALYKMAAEIGWSQSIKARGGKKRDLDRRL
jgi:multimeric flavodoxin WrbA